MGGTKKKKSGSTEEILNETVLEINTLRVEKYSGHVVRIAAVFVEAADRIKILIAVE